MRSGGVQKRLPWLSREPWTLTAAGLAGAGLGIRIWAMVAYVPAVLSHQDHDGANYVQAARLHLSDGDQEPLGYPIFLRALHAITHQLQFTIGVQHLLGLLTGWLLFLTARRLGAGRWLALLPAAAAWLSGDQLFLEHALLSEPLFIFLLAATLYAGVRSTQDGAPWLAAVGLLAVAMLAVRTVALPIPLLVLAWAVLGRRRRPVAALRSLAVVGVAAAVATVSYAAVERSATGHFTLVVAGSGWDLYARAAEFADCRDFSPPAGTAVLCDRTPVARRAGVGYYHWLGGPAIRAFRGSPLHDAQVGAFARTAIAAQPLDLLSLAGSDLVRYVDPYFDNPRYGGFGGPEILDFPTGPAQPDPALTAQISAYYGRPHPQPPGTADGLAAYQGVARLNGPVLLLMLVITLAGMPLAVGRRWQLMLPLLLAAELLIVPTITGASWRYAVPASYPLVLAAAVVVPAVWQRLGSVVGLAVSDPGQARGEARAGTAPPPEGSAH